MKLLLWLLTLFAVASALDFDHYRGAELDRRADTTLSSSSSSSSKSETTVWVTITTDGATATVKTIWVQSFMSTYTEATSSAAAGSVGLGSLSGLVGGVRSYSETTITNGGAVVYSGVVGFAFMFFSWLI